MQANGIGGTVQQKSRRMRNFAVLIVLMLAVPASFLVYRFHSQSKLTKLLSGGAVEIEEVALTFGDQEIVIQQEELLTFFEEGLGKPSETDHDWWRPGTMRLDFEGGGAVSMEVFLSNDAISFVKPGVAQIEPGWPTHQFNVDRSPKTIQDFFRRIWDKE